MGHVKLLSSYSRPLEIEIAISVTGVRGVCKDRKEFRL
jgi:hypothetical protein